MCKTRRQETNGFIQRSEVPMLGAHDSPVVAHEATDQEGSTRAGRFPRQQSESSKWLRDKPHSCGGMFGGSFDLLYLSAMVVRCLG